jgi:hypothetical protein
MADPVPPHIAAAASTVEAWLAQQQASTGRVSEDQWKGMSHAERLDYNRKFDQTHFQPREGKRER